MYWVETGESARLTQLARSPRDLAWSHDGRRIAFSMLVPGLVVSVCAGDAMDQRLDARRLGASELAVLAVDVVDDLRESFEAAIRGVEDRAVGLK